MTSRAPKSAFAAGTRVAVIVLAAIASSCGICVVGGFGLRACNLMRPEIQAACRVGGLGGSADRCTFTNVGSGSGSMCVVVHLRHRASGATLTSQATCSGDLASRASIEHSVTFVEAQPYAFCAGGIETTCEMRVEQTR